jgi:hypothetical protein
VACWGLALFGFTISVAALMLVHILTHGAIFSNLRLTQGLIFGISAATLGIRFLRPRPEPIEREGSWVVRWTPLFLVILGYVVWAQPLFVILPQSFNGDTQQHVIEGSQLLNGESTPSAPVTGDIPNDYPYLFHAEAATLARVTPGGRILHAYGPLLVLLVGGGVLTLYALGRELRRWTSGVFLALFGALAGGFGWLITRSPEVITFVRNPEQAERYLGDFLVKRSYNFALANLAPSFPRDLSYALFTCFLLLLVMGAKRKSMPLLVGAGVTAGMLGLTGGEAFFAAVGISLLAIAIGVYRRSVLSIALLVPALGLYSCWAIPMLLNYLKLGGFEDLSAAPVTFPPLVILGSWGLTTPFALYGGLRVVPMVKSTLEARLVLIALIVPAVAVIGTSLTGSTFPEGISTLGRPHRYWPLLYLGAALLASIGAALFVEWLARIRWYIAASFSLVIVAAAGFSPLLTSFQYGRQIKEEAMLHRALTGDSGSAIDIVSPRPMGNCVVAVPQRLSTQMAAYSGYRFVFYPEHPARIRWPELPRTPFETRYQDNLALVSGTISRERLSRMIDSYSLDIIVTESRVPRGSIYEEYESVISSEGHTVVTLNAECRSERFERP